MPRNDRSTALFTYECQSFLDNVIAGLGQIGAWNGSAQELEHSLGKGEVVSSILTGSTSFFNDVDGSKKSPLTIIRAR